MKRLTKTDRIFLVVLAAACLFQLFFLFGPPMLDDETFYLSFPFRLMQGDSLVQDEWHLAQFSSLFSYFPVRIWCALRGSADGLVVFMRCFYLAVHTAAAVLIYGAFRKEGIPAIPASMFFYLQTPYRIYSISYHSMFVLFLLLSFLLLLYIYQSGAKKYCFAAGVSFGACCVNNPLFCVFPLLYLLMFLIFKKKRKSSSVIISNHAGKKNRKSKKTKKTKNSGKPTASKARNSHPSALADSYENFFNRQTVLYMSLGIAAIAAVSVIFFFATGGTIASLQQNLKYLFSTSEYHLASFSLHDKLLQAWEAVYYSSFRMPFLLPLLFLAILLDKKRKNVMHSIFYFFLTLVFSVLFFIGSMIRANLSSLPFFLLSTVCYLLTEKKNHVLFSCMWCTFAFAAVVSFFAANSPLASIGTILPLGNIAGVFFARDLLKELQQRQADESFRPKTRKRVLFANRAIICFGLVFQILVLLVVLPIGQLPFKKSVRITEGPLEGIRMSENQYETYEAFLRDMDDVKARSAEEDPLLIAAYQNWLYLYAERPIAAHTAWFRGTIVKDDLLSYYRVNPQKIPRYIYVANSDGENYAEPNIKLLKDLFSFTQEPLSGGVLLTVTGCRFER